MKKCLTIILSVLGVAVACATDMDGKAKVRNGSSAEVVKI